MWLSLNWLADHVDLSGLDPEEIGTRLTMRTALIEAVVDQRAALDGVVVGEVLSCGPHPDADRLSVCMVEHGAGEPAHVVCGAPNVATGQKIIYAPVGTKLPNGLKLKKAKIRGLPSAGMICAEDEIGLGPEHDGIIVLDGELEPGRPIGEVSGLADVLFEIDNKSVTHRPDLWGHYGFARELAALYGRELRPLELATDLVPGDAGPAIELADPEGCPLYAGLCIDDVSRRSPDWMRFRLVACGMRPLGLLIDLSNYVMLELGQPTHPFDRDRLAGDRIEVRRASEGEVLRTLDDIDRRLTGEDVVIADGEQAVALAGIMGSASSEVQDGTSRVFLEAACFHPERVRRTSSRLGLRSEALARFEKSLDPALVEESLRRYAALVRRLSPEARIEPTFRIVGQAAAPETRIRFDAARATAVLGREVEDREITTTLGSVGFGVTAAGPGQFEVAVPSWRATRDVSIAEDLIEEVGRLAGYDAVPTVAPRGTVLVGRRDPVLELEDQLRDCLARDAAFTESLAYSMVDDGALTAVGWDAARTLPRLANPLQQDAARLRPSPAPGLLVRLEGWLRHGPEVRTFEIGRGYEPGEGADGEVRESRQCVALYGRRREHAGPDVERVLRGVADAAVAALGRPRPRLEAAAPPEHEPWFHPRRAARLLVGDAPVGWLGTVSPEVLPRLGVDAHVGLLMLDLAGLAGVPSQPTRYVPIPRYPAARIDLAFLIGPGLTVEQVREAIQGAGKRTLVSVEPFDVYRGETLGEGERSVAFHLVFQAKDRTLTDDDVAAARERVVKAVAKLGASLR